MCIEMSADELWANCRSGGYINLPLCSTPLELSSGPHYGVCLTDIIDTWSAHDLSDLLLTKATVSVDGNFHGCFLLLSLTRGVADRVKSGSRAWAIGSTSCFLKLFYDEYGDITCSNYSLQNSHPTPPSSYPQPSCPPLWYPLARVSRLIWI